MLHRPTAMSKCRGWEELVRSNVTASPRNPIKSNTNRWDTHLQRGHPWTETHGFGSEQDLGGIQRASAKINRLSRVHPRQP